MSPGLENGAVSIADEVDSAARSFGDVKPDTNRKTQSSGVQVSRALAIRFSRLLTSNFAPVNTPDVQARDRHHYSQTTGEIMHSNRIC
jgi:hypothetical protein